MAIECVNKNLSQYFHCFSDKNVEIFVTIGYPNNPIPIQNKTCMVVFTNNMSIVQAAKKYRKEISEEQRINIEVKPSDLYWAIFAHRDDRIHILGSENFPGIYDEKLNPNGILVNINC